MRQAILDLLSGKKNDTCPAFSGLIHITSAGLQHEGLSFHEVHQNADKMARAAASTYKLCGLPSAALPLDMYVEAEAIGARINFRENSDGEYPQVAKAAFASVKELLAKTQDMPAESFLNKGRIPLVCDAIGQLKKDVGQQVVIGAIIPGPYTLLLLTVETGRMFLEMKKEPALISTALTYLSGLLSLVAKSYRQAGADFITIHDMGGSPAFIGPVKYEQFVLPAERQLLESLPKPHVLSVCGNVTNALPLLAQAGADAISIDQTVNLEIARRTLKDVLLFGNLDPVALLYEGNDTDIRSAAEQVRQAGLDALWPGCDLVLQTPIQNLQTYQKA